MTDNINNESLEATEAIEATEATETAVDPKARAMPLPEGLETSGAKGDENVLNTLLGIEVEKTQPEPEAETEVEEVEEEEVETEEEESSPEPAEENRGEDYERALAALQRDGTPRHLLDEEYERNPQRFIEWGLKRAKVQADGDRFSQEFAEMKSKVEATQQAEGETESNGADVNKASSTAQPASPVDLETQRSQIADIFGEEAANAVLQPMEQMARSFHTVIEQQKMQILQLSQIVEQKELASVRSRMQERFPQMADDSAFEKVKNKAVALVQTGQYKSYDDVMLDAARITFAEEIEAVKTADKISKAKSAGQPKSRSNATKVSRPKSVIDQDEQVLESLMSGMTPDEIQKQFKI